MNELANEKSFTEQNRILLIFLFLFGIDFALRGIYIFAIVAGLIILINGRRIAFTSTTLCMTFFAALFFAFFVGSSHFEMGILLSIFASMIAFMAGQNLFLYNDNNILTILIVISFGMASHGLLNLIYNFYIYGMDVFSNYTCLDFWGKTFSASTAQAIHFTPFLALGFYLLFLCEKKVIKAISFVTLVLFILYNFMLGGRSGFIILVIALVLGILFSAFVGIGSKSMMRIFAALAAMIIIAAILYYNDVFNIKTTIEGTYFFHRFFSVSGQDITYDSRLSMKQQYVDNMWNYPFGGSHMRIELGIGYAHELWLDIYDLAGIFPYAFLLLYTFSSVIRLIRVFRSNYFRPENKVAIGSFYVVMLIQFFIEPIIYGSPKLFVMYCFVDGIIDRYILECITSEKESVVAKDGLQ